MDVLHARLVEDLAGGRVRILTQETQIGQPAAAPAQERPNPMLNGHQAWLDGLVRTASEKAGSRRGSGKSRGPPIDRNRQALAVRVECP
ncbi:hypothetical protein [Streptomyces sp. NPDC059378]|uniref:hypothetical protein n=1 Tax=Streptomyces sp. NPDC059378 TaxID=3346815 RepID=UPI003693619C